VNKQAGDLFSSFVSGSRANKNHPDADNPVFVFAYISIHQAKGIQIHLSGQIQIRLYT
jgi:hypothetical protein